MWKSAKYSMLAVLHFAAGTAHNGRRLAPLQKGGESHAKTSDFSCFGFPHSSHGKKQGQYRIILSADTASEVR
ncbi:hypothetical protein, partial [Gemmiger sp.]|uniref:hypothetical protein n=1 Tax=Gemmiger sp. TaxID=2049027 RepID=UPI0025BB13A2